MAGGGVGADRFVSSRTDDDDSKGVGAGAGGGYEDRDKAAASTEAENDAVAAGQAGEEVDEGPVMEEEEIEGSGGGGMRGF